MDYKVELVPIPVADMDRAKKFYLDDTDPDGNIWLLQEVDRAKA